MKQHPEVTLERLEFVVFIFFFLVNNNGFFVRCLYSRGVH